PQLRVPPPQLHPPRVNGGTVPGRIVQEMVQPLAISPGNHSSQLGQRLITLPGQQQPDQVMPQGSALGQPGEQVIEMTTEPVDRLCRRRGRLTRRNHQAPPRTAWSDTSSVRPPPRPNQPAPKDLSRIG